MKKKLLSLTLLFTAFAISSFGQATGSWYTPVDFQALSGTLNTTYGCTGTALALNTTTYRTGSNSLSALYTGSNSAKTWWNDNLGIVPPAATGYVHVICWVKGYNATSTATLNLGYCATATAGKNSATSIATATSLNTTTWTRVTGYCVPAKGTAYTYYPYPSFSYGGYWDDFVIYYDASSSTTDVVEPNVAPSAVSGTTTLSWTNGSDAGTGVQGTIILGTNSTSPAAIVNGTNLLDQGYYPVGGTVATDWTVLTNISGTATTTYAPTTTYTTYAVINYDKAYNFSAATTYTPIVDPTSDATLSALSTSAGTMTPSFSAATTTYSVALPYGTTVVPTVSATANVAGAQVAIVDATAVTGTATVTVTATNGTTKGVYTLNYTVATGVNQATNVAKVYASGASIIVEGNAGANVSVVSLDGSILYSSVVSSTKETLPVSLQTGVYAVRINGVATKVIVK